MDAYHLTGYFMKYMGKFNFFMIFPISVNIEMLRTDFYLLKSKLMQRILKWMVFLSPLKIIVRLSKM